MDIQGYSLAHSLQPQSSRSAPTSSSWACSWLVATRYSQSQLPPLATGQAVSPPTGWAGSERQSGLNAGSESSERQSSVTRQRSSGGEHGLHYSHGYPSQVIYLRQSLVFTKHPFGPLHCGCLSASVDALSSGRCLRYISQHSNKKSKAHLNCCALLFTKYSAILVNLACAIKE